MKPQRVWAIEGDVAHITKVTYCGGGYVAWCGAVACGVHILAHDWVDDLDGIRRRCSLTCEPCPECLRRYRPWVLRWRGKPQSWMPADENEKHPRWWGGNGSTDTLRSADRFRTKEDAIRYRDSGLSPDWEPEAEPWR